MPRFLDTNILLRYLTRDDEAKAQASLGLLSRVERGEEVVVTSDLVIAEVVFNLQSPRQYGLSRDHIRQLVEPIVELRGLRLANKGLYRRAFDLFCDKRISFVDAYNAAYMESRGVTEVYSYDTEFDRVEGVRRVEPEVET
ncbi:MAG: type II toxin-antitoxin system VapC family toxin [Chloroflexi bacterium]|nr:type II toxin-antitoxin system VapC family toxin [Chloroflexota bacterium]